MTEKLKKSRNIVGIVLVILIGLVIWSMINVVNARSKSKDKHLGIAEYEKGNYQEAINYYNKGLEANSNDACLYNNQGLACLGLEKYDRAIHNFDKAIELHPDFMNAYYNRGLAYFKKGSSYNLEPRKKAIENFTKAIELQPNFVDAYYNRAVTYTEQIHYHHKYRTIPPKFPSEDMDNYNKAFADYAKVLTLDPSYVLAYQGRGNLFYRHGDWDLANKEYDIALARQGEILIKVGNVGLAGVLNSRGRNELAWGKLEDAISDFTKAIERYRKGIVNKEAGLSKSVTNALAHRTAAAWELGRWKDTIKYCDETIEVKESNPKKYGTSAFYYFTKGKCYYRLGRYDEAISNLEKVLKEVKYGMDVKAKLWLGRVYRAKGDEEKAENLTREALKASNKDVEKADEFKLYKAYLQRGLCYLELKEYNRAISDFQETIKWRVFADKPANHTNYWLDAHKFTGVAYMKAGDRNKTKEYLQKTIELAEERGFNEVVEEAKELLTKL
jgi:tetratricopeptide (TPR) repeat protein